MSTIFTLHSKPGRRQKRRDYGNQGRRWTARDELRRRLPQLHGKLRDRSLWAIHSRDQHQASMALDAVIANQDHEGDHRVDHEQDDRPHDDLDHHAYPPIGDEIFNLTEEELREAWGESDKG